MSTVQFIETWSKNYIVSLLCHLLKIIRSVYYFYKKKALAATEINKFKKIQPIFG